jgi:hypothetical protein
MTNTTARALSFTALLFARVAAGQAPAAEPAQAADAEGDSPTTIGASAYYFVVPESSDYLQPTLSVDHRAVHFEARYNYEALVTASVWAGYGFSGGERVTWEITPMLGGVFGRTNGLSPGYRGSLGFWKLELYSEGELVFGLGSDAEHFFYNWSELACAPVEWFRLGLVTQRTRAHESERVLDRGFLAGFSLGPASLTAYLLNPDDSRPVFAVALAAELDVGPSRKRQGETDANSASVGSLPASVARPVAARDSAGAAHEP